MLYPLKFTPILKDKIWGGTTLSKFGKQLSGATHVGESWELSAFDDQPSVVASGALKDNDLSELIEVYMGDLVGDHVYEKYGNYFPLLIKLIDAEDKLSLQVHPNDEAAWKEHQSSGKTEMWYVLDAEPGSTLTLGLKHEAKRSELEQSIFNGHFPDLLYTVPVHQGDVAFIPAGMLHAIGAGVRLVEIQQASDITYRLYDYDRRDAAGNKRELHLNKALEVLDYSANKEPLIDYTTKVNGAINLVSCDYFVTNLLCFDKCIVRDYAPLDSFVVYCLLSGSCSVETDLGNTALQTEETVLLPAMCNDVKLTPLSRETRLLEVYVP